MSTGIQQDEFQQLVEEITEVIPDNYIDNEEPASKKRKQVQKKNINKNILALGFNDCKSLSMCYITFNKQTGPVMKVWKRVELIPEEETKISKQKIWKAIGAFLKSLKKNQSIPLDRPNPKKQQQRVEIVFEKPPNKPSNNRDIEEYVRVVANYEDWSINFVPMKDVYEYYKFDTIKPATRIGDYDKNKLKAEQTALYEACAHKFCDQLLTDIDKPEAMPKTLLLADYFIRVKHEDYVPVDWAVAKKKPVVSFFNSIKERIAVDDIEKPPFYNEAHSNVGILVLGQ